MTKKLFCGTGGMMAGESKRSGAVLELAADGRCGYQVVIPGDVPDPSVAERLAQAARLFRRAFEANGFDLPVAVEGRHDPGRPGIYLGDTRFARAAGVEVAALADWEYLHRAVGRDLVIAGRDEPPGVEWEHLPGWPATGPRLGTVKGTVDFLRRYAGARFLYPGEPGTEFLPMPAIAVPAGLDETVVPALEVNFDARFRAGWNDYEIANNIFPAADIVYNPHTYSRAAPPEEYAAAHPEYFAMLGGKRVVPGDANHAQYCVSNPELQALIFRDLVSWVDRGARLVGLGQPDGFRPCECGECRALYGTGEDWGEKLWLLHRDLALKLERERPRAKVLVLSYSRTEQPPKSFREFPPNMVVQLCDSNEESFAAWAGYRVPAGFAVYLYNWGTYHPLGWLPKRSPRFVEEQARRFARHRVRNIFKDGWGNSFGLEAPVYYVFGRLYDDPAHARAADLLEEFYEAAFREAAGPMRNFYNELYHDLELYSEFLGIRCGRGAENYRDVYGNRRQFVGDPLRLIGFLFPPDLLGTMEENLGRAEKTAAGETVKIRLALVRREFEYLKGIALATHAWHAFRARPDCDARDRVLEAVDGWRALVNGWYDAEGRLIPLPGWPEVGPFPAHGDRENLLLRRDHYMRRFRNTPFNWDTEAVRGQPLGGARRAAAHPVAGRVDLDAPAWAGASRNRLETVPAGLQPASGDFFQLLYDGEKLYLRAECESPAPPAADPAGEGGLAGGGVESVQFSLAPFADREKFYRFLAGPDAGARYQAARGFVSDGIDPRYGNDDPDWRGTWSCETRIEPGRWLVLLTIPFRSLDAAAPTAGAAWHANFGRVRCAGAGRTSRAIWSPTRKTDEFNTAEAAAFGEIMFAGDDWEPEKHPVQKIREEIYRTSFMIPPEWEALSDRLPADAWGPWRFRIDPVGRGLEAGWQSRELADGDWPVMPVPAYWAETGAGGYLGGAWYRVRFRLPAAWHGRTLRLMFGGVDEQAWVYVNGEPAGEHTVDSEKRPIEDLCDRPFTVEVAPDRLDFGGDNLLAVRVHASTGNAGIWRPVIVQAEPAKGR